MTSYFRILLTGLALIIQGCYVGTQVHIKSDYLEYPVSYTKSFYSHNYNLIDSTDYKIIEDFSFSFTKWGISAPLNIESEEEISAKLNNIIQEKNGDAIVALTISVNSAPVNDFLLVPKILSFWISIIGVPLFISDPTRDKAVIVASAVAVYLFTPAVAKVTIQGKVVKIVE